MPGVKMKIMIVEDDEALAGEVRSFLEKWGYEVSVAERFDEITQEFSEHKPQLVLMDINLPYYDGFYWCTRIRQISEVPIIYISSRNDDRDQIMAIAQGGDDYVEKPFRLQILRAKVEAILRRTYQYKVKEQIFISVGLEFDPVSSSLFFDGKEIELTRSERRIFSRLMEARPDVVFRDELMMELWNTDEYVSDGTLTTVICRLRNKLKCACGKNIINTKKGQGYFVL
ncbi:MAG: response regulator transcription factor [Bacillota bacterium]|nr:response regulator transcription factor [Bacillota bacterium]